MGTATKQLMRAATSWKAFLERDLCKRIQSHLAKMVTVGVQKEVQQQEQ
jgi:hypothetical protein